MLKKVLLSAVAICLILACAMPFTAFAAEKERSELKLPFKQTDLKGILSVGSKGVNVMRVQKRLMYYGFYYYNTVNPDGIYGNTVKQAVLKFQRANDLKADGKVGYNTWAVLISDAGVKKSDDPWTNVLCKGDHGDDVKEMQERLKYYGYYTGKIDGSFGSKTESAVTAFQTKNGLNVDGKIGEDTRNLLRSDTALAKTDPTFERIEKGDTGNRVMEIQVALYDTYYYAENIDGIFDSGLETAVINFQKSVGLTADGVIGGKTYDALVNRSASIFSGGSPERKLERSMRGYDVYVLQQKLSDMGYLTVTPAWGVFDAATEKAIKDYQKSIGMAETGICDIQLRGYIWSSGTPSEVFERIELGDTGKHVADVQSALQRTYYYNGDIDGIFDAEVKKAVEAFQQSTGLTVDGIVGEITYNALVNGTASIFNYGSPKRTLQRTMSGYDVYVLQKKLAEMNYMEVTPQWGLYDDATVNAVKAFQKANKISETGVCDTQLRRYIWPSDTVAENEEATESAGTTLKKGSHGAAVSNLQMRLKAAGFLLGNADGIYGDKTEKAVKNLQKKYSIKQDGICGPITWSVLLNELDNVWNADPELVEEEKHAYTTPLSKLYAGTSGVAVTKLQQMLVDAGFLSSSDVDGKFGPITKQAVIDFQTSANIAADGIVGSKTYVALYEALGIN